jgi:hypothetical protein
MSEEKKVIDMPESSENELDRAIAEAEADAVSTYVHHFKKPFLWMGQEYETMAFNFEDLTGRDMQAIEREMSMMGQAVVSPALSGEFLLRMAARAAGIGVDAILAMPIHEAATIRTKARSFLLRSEL